MTNPTSIGFFPAILLNCNKKQFNIYIDNSMFNDKNVQHKDWPISAIPKLVVIIDFHCNTPYNIQAFERYIENIYIPHRNGAMHVVITVFANA